MKVTLSPEQVAIMQRLHESPSTLVTKVLTMKAQGLTHQQIADALGYSKSHIGKVSSLALKAYKQGGVNV